MFKKICKLIICCIIMLYFMSCSLHTVAYSPFIETENLSIDEFDSIKQLYNDLLICAQEQQIAHQMAECARALGYEDNNVIIVIAKQHWLDAQEQRQITINRIDYAFQCFNEYPYATYIWYYLINEVGCNEAQAAGILGNIMAEVGGGGTLDIQYWLYSYDGGHYYGMCQWSKTYFPEIRGKDLIEQCKFLKSNIEYQINAFGQSYGKNNAYEEFLALDSYRDAAIMFAKLYEACDSASYTVRQNYAEKAYNYFMGLS